MHVLPNLDWMNSHFMATKRCDRCNTPKNSTSVHILTECPKINITDRKEFLEPPLIDDNIPV